MYGHYVAVVVLKPMDPTDTRPLGEMPSLLQRLLPKTATMMMMTCLSAQTFNIDCLYIADEKTRAWKA